MALTTQCKEIRNATTVLLVSGIHYNDDV